MARQRLDCPSRNRIVTRASGFADFFAESLRETTFRMGSAFVKKKGEGFLCNLLFGIRIQRGNPRAMALTLSVDILFEDCFDVLEVFKDAQRIPG